MVRRGLLNRKNNGVNMATVLVSFIGIGEHLGEESPNVSKSGYREVTYTFENNFQSKTTIFGSALHKFLVQQKKETVDSWLIMGTPQSIWCDLIQMFEHFKDILKDENIKKQYNFLKEEAAKDRGNKGTPRSQIKQEHLNDWSEFLTSKLNSTKIICKEVGDATDETSQNKIFSSLLEVIKDKDKVVFDVTHGLRNQPIVTSFIVMYLRYLKNITDVKFYYGAKELNGKVIKLNFCKELLQATEAVAIYEQTGNYEQIGKQLKLSDDFNDNISKTLFADEMHKADKEIPLKIIDTLENTNFDSKPISKSMADFLIKAFSWAKNDSYAERLKEKAKKAFEKGQYFKAIASLWESLGVISCDVAKKNEYGQPINSNNFKQRNWAVKRREGYKLLNDNENQLKNIEHLRNTVLHGSDDKNQKIQEATQDLSNFERIFKGGLIVFEKIKAFKK